MSFRLMEQASSTSQPRPVSAVVVSVVTDVALLSIFALFARTILNSFQKTEGLLLLSGRARETFYEIWSITVPSVASILVSLAAVLWVCIKVFRSKWPKRCLLVIAAYIAALLIFQWFLVGLGFEAFD